MNWHTTIGWLCQNICSFLQFITGFLEYYLSWMLLTSHCRFKKPVCIFSSSNWTFHSLTRSVGMVERDHVAISPAVDLLKLDHHEFAFWFWLTALSHLRMKAKFSPLVSPVELALNSVLKNALLSNSIPFWKAPQLHEYFFCRKLFKK